MDKTKKWKNFLSLWTRNKGNMCASGKMSLEGLCKVLSDQNVIPTSAARDLYRIFKEHIPSMDIDVVLWRNDRKRDKQPDYAIGWNKPYQREEEGTSSSTNDEDVPF